MPPYLHVYESSCRASDLGRAKYVKSCLTSVIIGSGRKHIYGGSFASCINLADVYCYAESVPSIERDAYDDSYIEYATLHVPSASIDAYKNADQWKNFGSIVALTDNDPKPTGITNIKQNIITGQQCYSLDGKRVDNMKKGLNVIRMKAGTTRKVIVK